MNLNLMELQNLRHMIGAHETAEKKLNFYAEQCSDPKSSRCFSNLPNLPVRPDKNLCHF